DAVRAGLRLAVERSILVASEDGRTYTFRHALLREAVYDDLLPADRVALHQRVADALSTNAALRSTSAAVAAAELARHRDAAGQLDLAREGYLEAGNAAFRATAWAESAASFERAFEISASDPDSSADQRIVTILPTAAFAIYWTDGIRRAAGLLDNWIDRLERAGRSDETTELWLALAQLHNHAGNLAGEAAVRDVLLGRELPPAGTHAHAAM